MLFIIFEHIIIVREECYGLLVYFAKLPFQANKNGKLQKVLIRIGD
jgi:hypothetical protein